MRPSVRCWTLVAVLAVAGGCGAAQQLAQSYPLEVRARHLGEGHLCVAQSQNSLGELEYRDLAQSHANLGSLHKAIALYEPARRHYEKALANRRRLGEDLLGSRTQHALRSFEIAQAAPSLRGERGALSNPARVVRGGRDGDRSVQGGAA